MSTTQPLLKPRQSAGWRPVFGVAALMLSLVLMHGFGFGHGAHSSSATSTSASSSAPIGHADPGAPGGGSSHSAGAPVRGPAGGSDPVTGSSPDDLGHTASFAQMCVALLALVSLVGLAFVRALPRAHPQPSRPVSRKSVRVFDRPPWLAPDIHGLCVMRI